MTIQAATLSSPDLQESAGAWRPWAPPFANPPAGKVRGIAYASLAPWNHDLLTLIGRGLHHGPAFVEVTQVRGNPLLHCLTAVAVNGRLRAYVLTDDILLCATRASDGTWAFTEEVRPTFPDVAQLFAVQDGDVTDLYALEAGSHRVYTLRVGVDKNWRLRHTIDQADPGRIGTAGAASSKPGRREIAIGGPGKIRLLLSTDDGPFTERESLDNLPFTPQHVVLATPRPAGDDLLYAVAVAADGQVASSRFLHASNEWGQVFLGTAMGTALGAESTAAPISITPGQINIMVTANHLIYPREYSS